MALSVAPTYIAYLHRLPTVAARDAAGALSGQVAT
jgi:hypothetical protein